MNIQWYKDDNELLPAINVKLETSDTKSQLRLTKCQRKDSGEVKIKIKNEYGTMEAISKLIVLGESTIRRFGPYENIMLYMNIDTASCCHHNDLYSFCCQTNRPPHKALWTSWKVL